MERLHPTRTRRPFLSALRRPLWIGLASALLLTRCDCDFFGTTGALFISESDELDLGAEFDRQLRDSAQAEYPLYIPSTAAEIAFVAYVDSLCRQVLNTIPENGKPGYAVNPGFKFTLIDKDVQNAFAVPGGYVYLYTGIIKSMQDESELVGVIGHEIAHVTRHHYRDALAKQAGLSLLVQALVGNDAGKLTQLVAQSFATLAALSISRSNESEADTYGTRYEGAVCRNPMGIAKFFQRMENQGITILSTHPKAENRVEEVTKQVNADPVLRALSLDSAATNFRTRFEQRTAVIR
jgi:predicted Zn-dependent protease